jgi:hypothetical protein
MAKDAPNCLKLAMLKGRSDAFVGGLLWMDQCAHSCMARLRLESRISTEACNARLCGFEIEKCVVKAAMSR